MTTYAFKRGTSFGYQVKYNPGVGAPADLADVAISSQVRTPAGALVSTLDIAKAADKLSFTAIATAGTATWPVGPLHWDVKLVFQGQVIYTETLFLEIQKPVTE